VLLSSKEASNMSSSLSPELAFSATLETSPHEFLQPSLELHSAALALAKFYLDPVAAAVSSHQQSRLAALGQDRKRKRDYEHLRRSTLRLKHLSLPGFDSNQVWEQARRIIDSLNQQVLQANKEREEDGYETVTSDEDEAQHSHQGSPDGASSGSDVEENGHMDSADPEAAAEDPSSEEDIEQDDESASSDNNSPSRKNSEVLVKDRFGLNDGFFSIDEFNRRTEGWEYNDARGDGDAEAESDEEDIDWDINPMDINANLTSKEPMSESGSDDDDGPTFEEYDSGQGSDGPDDDDPMEEDAIGNANNITYADFFEPPARKAPKKSKTKKNRDPNVASASPDRDIEETMSMVRRDIFSDEEGNQDQLRPGASAHEQRKAAILTQIRELEAVNVSKKPWTLAGEARGQDRPLNAVLEEDLDFERAGKPIPVVTKETSEGIEQLIKRRILASQFDEVRKRRPDEAIRATSGRGNDQVDQSLEAPRKRGLADIYEEEYLRKNDPAFVEQKDEKVAKEHAEIEELWKDVVHKLDSLASFRYRPKQDEITVSVRADAPAMNLEDARPGGVGGAVGVLSQLAPQEIYTAAGEKFPGKVVTKGGTVVAREELTREDRKRRRRREKERAKKAGPGAAAARKRGSAKSRDAAALVGQLKAGDVKVIGKEGSVKRVDGKDIQTAIRGGASLKL
jgi:U3 small nucleolar RNA-associated protein MPP10